MSAARAGVYERKVREKQLVSCVWERMSLYSYVVFVFRGTSASCFVFTLFTDLFERGKERLLVHCEMESSGCD